MADVASYVVVAQTRPTKGIFKGMTGPASRNPTKKAKGSCLLSRLWRSTRKGLAREYALTPPLSDTAARPDAITDVIDLRSSG
jgi:hypothetical protein